MMWKVGYSFAKCRVIMGEVDGKKSFSFGGIGSVSGNHSWGSGFARRISTSLSSWIGDWVMGYGILFYGNGNGNGHGVST